MPRRCHPVLAALLLSVLLAGPATGCAQQLVDSGGYPIPVYAGAHDLLRGNLIDVRLVHAHSDVPFWLFSQRGRIHAGGQEGQVYEIEVRNRTGERVLVVPSVDGVNTLSGETASVQQSGYVLQPWQVVRIDGWRKSLDEVAQFVFSAHPDSYAERTGRPENVGVIGLAVFREHAPLAWSPPQPVLRQPPMADAAPAPPPASQSATAPSGRPLPPAPPAAGSPAARASSPMLADRAGPADNLAGKARRLEETLGTGHGQREESRVETTQFVRASDQPWETLRLDYDSLHNLEVRGIARLLPYRPQRIDPFPADRFVPDPPNG